MPDCSDKDDIEKCKPWVGTESSGKIEDVEKSYHHLGADNTNLSLVKGWLEDTLPQASYLHRGIDILRIDTDHYQSVFYTLQELYKHVNEGGLIILDDWHFNPKGVRGALNDFSDLLGISFEITIHEEGKGPAYFFKPSTTPQSSEIFPINKNLLQKTLDISISNSRKINGHNDPNFLRIHHNNHHILLYIKDYILKEKCKSVFEIGTHYGHSLVNILKSKYPSKIVSCDLFLKGKSIANDSQISDIEELANSNAGKFNLYNYEWKILKGNSWSQAMFDQVSAHFPSGIDLLFIDGDHHKKAVMNDFRNYFKLVRSGGFIVFDDYLPLKKANSNGLLRECPIAVTELISEYSSQLEIIGLVKDYPGCNKKRGTIKSKYNLSFIVKKI